MSERPSPIRVQLRRARGWRLPGNTVVVTRPGRWANPHRVLRDHAGWWVTVDENRRLVFATQVEARRHACRLFVVHVDRRPELLADARRALVGRNIACWCALPADGEPDYCHAAVWIDLSDSNAPLVCEMA